MKESVEEISKLIKRNIYTIHYILRKYKNEERRERRKDLDLPYSKRSLYTV